MLSALGRIAGIVAPFAGQHFLASDSSGKLPPFSTIPSIWLKADLTGILWLGAGGIWLAAIMCVFIPVEMRTRQMF